MAEHSPLPWRVEACDLGDWGDEDRCEGIRDADGNRVVTTDSGVYEPDLATAQFIVRACNSHADLLAALKALRDPAYGNPCFPDDTARIDAMADAAIAKAEGREVTHGAA